MPGFISTGLTIVAMIGVAYTLAATALAGRWRPRGTVPAPADAPSITMLKPLHGPEPQLEAKLGAFLNQEYLGPIDMVAGVADPADPAAASVRALQAKGRPATLVANDRRSGSNGKISNLINMMSAASGELLVLSDSDMVVPHDYAARIAAEMARPGVGAVTLLYAGRGETGGWSQLAAAGISWGFLPSVMIGLATGMAKPCMGSTIAIRSTTLKQIGGFERFADLLADDHAIGAAVREVGLEVVVPPLIVLHGSTEASLAELARHELR
ncbi:MAG TPA: glycosyltransferase, partial [Sphingomonas sp.]|nr:glycosyltransferase [Sphingomonas sp.]